MNSITLPGPLRPDGTLAAQNNRLSLFGHHHEQLRLGSGLTDLTISQASLWSEASADRATSLLGWKSRFPAASLPALVFPNYGIDGRWNSFYLRPDHPRLDRDGDQIKYEAPRGEPRLYFPPLIHPWRWRDPREPVILCEGVKKALVLAQHGFLAVAAHGVWMWHRIAHRKATGEWLLLKDMDPVLLPGREFFIAFDWYDTTHNVGVKDAEWHLGKMLRAANMRFRLMRIPFSGTEKVGIDDLLSPLPFTNRVGQVNELMASASMPPENTDTQRKIEFLRDYARSQQWRGRNRNVREVLFALLTLAHDSNSVHVVTNFRELETMVHLGRGAVARALSSLESSHWISCLSKDKAIALGLLDQYGSSVFRIHLVDFRPDTLLVSDTPSENGNPAALAVGQIGLPETGTYGEKKITSFAPRLTAESSNDAVRTAAIFVGSTSDAVVQTSSRRTEVHPAGNEVTSFLPPVPVPGTPVGVRTDLLEHDVWRRGWSAKKAIYQELLDRSLSVVELRRSPSLSDLSQSSIYAHLAEMKRSGLIRSSGRGRWTAVTEVSVLTQCAGRRGTARMSEQSAERIQRERRKYWG